MFDVLSLGFLMAFVALCRLDAMGNHRRNS